MMRMKFETYWILLLAAFLGGWIAPALAQIKSAERIPFGHTVSLVPDTGIPSLISVVNTGDAPIAKVRAIFLIDGQFLSVPLPYHVASQSFRGRFPTPSRSASYQFQFILRSGRAVLSDSFQLPLTCSDAVGGVPQDSPQGELLRLQRTEQQLRYITFALQRLLKGAQ